MAEAACWVCGGTLRTTTACLRGMTYGDVRPNKVWVSTCKDLRIQFTVFHLVKPFGKKTAGDSTVLGLVERRSIKTWIGSCLKRSCTP